MVEAGRRLPTGGVEVCERSGQDALPPRCTVSSSKLAQDPDDLPFGKTRLRR
jgi:hypothetical protein